MEWKVQLCSQSELKSSPYAVHLNKMIWSFRLMMTAWTGGFYYLYNGNMFID